MLKAKLMRLKSANKPSVTTRGSKQYKTSYTRPPLILVTKFILTEREDSYIAGTKIGGRKAAATNKAKYGDDFYKVQGAKGGKKGAADGAIKGFAANRKLASIAGAIGGKKSRRTKKV